MKAHLVGGKLFRAGGKLYATAEPSCPPCCCKPGTCCNGKWYCADGSDFQHAKVVQGYYEISNVADQYRDHWTRQANNVGDNAPCTDTFIYDFVETWEINGLAALNGTYIAGTYTPQPDGIPCPAYETESCEAWADRACNLGAFIAAVPITGTVYHKNYQLYGDYDGAPPDADEEVTYPLSGWAVVSGEYPNVQLTLYINIPGYFSGTDGRRWLSFSGTTKTGSAVEEGSHPEAAGQTHHLYHESISCIGEVLPLASTAAVAYAGENYSIDYGGTNHCGTSTDVHTNVETDVNLTVARRAWAA